MTTYTLDLSNPNNLSTSIDANVLTIGNFDGVHRGHKAMLAQLKKSAKDSGCATMVMIFEPQPREYFAQLKSDLDAAPTRLTTAAEKIALLTTCGIENVVIAHFDEAFRSLSATDFADLLVNKLNVRALVLGDDFRFGHDRTGDSEFLRQYGLPVTNLHTVTDTLPPVSSHSLAKDRLQIDIRISSTRIRERLAIGDIVTANHLLGHDYSITGEVLHGDKIGRTLDFPTANIALNRLKPALHGIFGVDVTIVDTDGSMATDGFAELADTNHQGIAGLRPHSLFGTANIGTRPSVDKAHDWRLEVHFPNFLGNLYGKTLNVRFLHYLHGERHYDGLAALKQGIHQDVEDLLSWRDTQP